MTELAASIVGALLVGAVLLLLLAMLLFDENGRWPK